jgi:hypothetical protein
MSVKTGQNDNSLVGPVSVTDTSAPYSMPEEHQLMCFYPFRALNRKLEIVG